jgi:hypothetical protein
MKEINKERFLKEKIISCKKSGFGDLSLPYHIPMEP